MEVSTTNTASADPRADLRGIEFERDLAQQILQLVAPAPLGKALSGAKVEYVLMRLRPRETGKREATLHFDAGQGSQDLGFRAEVPILFTVK